ncbi:hypothetical protein Ais01nite_33860 [Asanoa ishikariensis]|uniref:Right handed beta helix region n=1 Tax=Asanoa ishikariensis TaxID=137265 RepID=A0A1H3L9V5_9ACTN|nr:right-handed parallel beta-helix repeat-containing protein [Asanoa ishikariensis]GIF65351.1 hypothetical protein Ais01nite_33860 [Asanoa ishikariensis]SDY61223.1 Right handed beta helix region [Asanoa ishikariensis]
MRVLRGLALLCVGALATAGFTAIAGNASAAASTIFVSKVCGSAPDGSEANPYCTISKAAEVAVAGQTIAVDKGDYTESVVVRSGQPGKPIRYVGYRGAGGQVRVVSAATGNAFVVSGVHDVVIDGFYLVGSGLTPAVVESSSDITISNGWILSPTVIGIDIKGDSHRVTVSGMSALGMRAPLVAVGAGATDTVLAQNSVRSTRAPGYPPHPAVAVTDAPNTTVTNNTIVTDCLAGIEVTGASGGFALYNSIVRTTAVGTPGRCGASSGPDPASVTPVTVTASATTDAHVDYNVIDPGHGGSLYSWAGTTYPNPGALAAATGQGAHDIGADPKLANVSDPQAAGWTLTAESPAIDSALADAPGTQATDLRGNAHADKPDTANAGAGFVDRGAVEFVPAPSLRSTMVRAPGGSAFETVATATATSPWTTDGPVGTFTLHKSNEKRIVNRTGIARFSFEEAGHACAVVQFSLDGFRGSAEPQYDSACMMLGAAYTAVTPRRVLDTRSAIGVPSTTPVYRNGEVQVPLPAPAATASAVVLNVTATKPTTAGALKVYREPGYEPNGYSVQFAANQTIANLVTVQVRDGKASISNESMGTVHVVADLVGYYADGDSGLRTATPARVLDTRSAIGVPGTAPMGAQGRVTVDLSSRVPAGTTAVVLNLTVTKPTQSGHVTLFPPGAAVPTASNVNFVAGQTVNNMVIAPVVGGRIAFAHGGSGTVHVIADLSGWYAPGVGDMLLPTYPIHLARPGHIDGVTVGPGQTLRVFVNANECGSTPCEPRTAVVANVTAILPQSGGYLSVYPYGQARPVMSAVNFTAHQIVASQVTVGLHEDSFMVYNSSSGNVEVSIDQTGLYLGSVS